jgi:integrase
VFADQIGDPLSPDMISSAFRALVKAAGLPRLTPLGMRHTFATLGLDSGADCSTWRRCSATPPPP